MITVVPTDRIYLCCGATDIRRGINSLAGLAGTLQADGFSGYNQIYKGGAIREAACLAHLCRKIFDVHDSQPTELSTTAMAGIQAIYRIEEEIRGLPPAERLTAHDEGGPDHWSARCDDSSCARATVCRAMPILPRPSPTAPSDGARSTASSTMANSSPTT